MDGDTNPKPGKEQYSARDYVRQAHESLVEIEGILAGIESALQDPEKLAEARKNVHEDDFTQLYNKLTGIKQNLLGILDRVEEAKNG